MSAEKLYLFHIVLDKDTLYMKIIGLDKIYKFLVLSFLFEIVKMVKKIL